MLTSDIDLRLPYISADLPGIGGVLRATPEHFVVEEVPLYPAAGEGQHLYVNLTKVGLTTKEVQAQLARLFKLDRGEVGFAGMKDKQARTTQTFSLNVGHHAPDYPADVLRSHRQRVASYGQLGQFSQEQAAARASVGQSLYDHRDGAGAAGG